MTIQLKQRDYRKSLSFLVGFYVLILAGFACLPYWPSSSWMLATLISFSPLWPYALPLFLLVPACFVTRQYGLIAALVFAVWLLIKISGAVFFAADEVSDSSDPLVVITANMGGGSIDALNKLIVENNADLIALQEVSEAWLAPLLNMSPLHAVCVGDLCLLSHLNLKLVDAKSRKLLQDSGQFALQVEVELPSGALDFYVVHLKSPRTGFQALMANPVKGWRKLREVTDEMVTESWIASSWVAQGRHSLVAGDFNLPKVNPMYQQYWHGFSDAFDEGGSGVGYSKYTRLHGIQIDHILHSQGWTAAKTWIGSSLGGDHHPVITILTPSVL